MESTSRDNSTNNTFWFFLVLCYCITAPSCGVFKKQVSRHSEKNQEKTEIKEESRSLNIDTTKRDFREFVEYRFTFRQPEFQNVQSREKPLGPSNNDLENKTLDQNIKEALGSLLGQVESLDIKVYKQEQEQKGIVQESEKILDKKEESKSELKSMDKEKDSNTTLAANIPWFAWIIGALLIFGIVVYLVKQFKPL